VDADQFQYLGLMAACLVLTLPLEFLFKARVWRRPRRLVAAMWLPVLIFAVWDVVAIARDHWTYNGAYVTGVQLPGDLPIEELVFFIVIPICSLLTYETVKRIVKR
jgi:lycopene cyclase domain-containing protein